MKAITADAQRGLWKTALSSNPRDFAIITIMATSAVRVGELVSMTVGSLNLSKGEVWVNGKRGWRKVFLGKASIKAVDCYLEVRPPSFCDGLWIGQRGGPLTADGVRQMIQRLAERADVEGRSNPHAFRHRAAQAWLDRGINAEIVSKAMGHADVTVTLSIYSNQDDSSVRKAIREVEMSPFYDLADLELDETIQGLKSGNR